MVYFEELLNENRESIALVDCFGCRGVQSVEVEQYKDDQNDVLRTWNKMKYGR